MEAIKMDPSPAIEVPKPITAAQVQSFIDDGYLVVPGLMEAAELAELKRDLVDVARGRYECDNIEPVDPALSDQAVLESILCIHQPHYVSPGSHRPGYLYPQRPHENPEEFDFAPESYGFDESAEVPVEVEAGTLVFFNGYLLHRSYKNRGDTYRRVLVNHYCNAWSLLPWSIEEGEAPARADRRTIVPVAGIDPYAWKGYQTPARSVSLRHCKAIDEVRAVRQVQA